MTVIVGTRTGVGLETVDKVQLAMDGMLGVKKALRSDIRPFRGVREAYSYCTGDWDCSKVGKGGFLKTTEAIATTDFPSILLDSINKKLIQDYAEVGMNGLEQVIT